MSPVRSGYSYGGAQTALWGALAVLIEELFVEIYKVRYFLLDVHHLRGKFEYSLHTFCGLHYVSNDVLLWKGAIVVNNAPYGRGVLPPTLAIQDDGDTFS